MKSRDFNIYRAKLIHRFNLEYMKWKKGYCNTDDKKLHFAMYNINRISHEIERDILDLYIKDGMFTPEQLEDVIMDIHFTAFQLMEEAQGKSIDHTIRDLIDDIFCNDLDTYQEDITDEEQG